MHISATPCANEALCLPCRTHGEEDKDYALGFATPLNAPGIKLLAVEPVSRTYGEEGEFDYPKTSELQPTECLIGFDDVFVPRAAGWPGAMGAWGPSLMMRYYYVKQKLYGVSAGRVERFAMSQAMPLLLEGAIEPFDPKKHGKAPGAECVPPDQPEPLKLPMH